MVYRTASRVHPHRTAAILLCILAAPVLACGPIAQVANTNTNTGSLPAAPIATGELAEQPTTYTAKWGGATYHGWHAQVLHQLFAVVPGYATTYADHNCAGGGLSADLWADGAGYGTNNSGMASMDMLAAYIATNMHALGIRYVVWEQRINVEGQGWSLMADRGNYTQNHLDHIHITFIDGALVTAELRQNSDEALRTYLQFNLRQNSDKGLATTIHLVQNSAQGGVLLPQNSAEANGNTRRVVAA